MGAFLQIRPRVSFTGIDGILCYTAASGRLGVNHHIRGFVSIPYERNRWYHCSLVFDWTRRRFDFVVDNVVVGGNLTFSSDFFQSVSSLHLYNFDNIQTWWDDIEVVEGGQVVPVAFTPTASGSFVQGTWVAPITVLEPAANIWLTADDGSGHVGNSTPFTILPSIDSDADNLPDAWEQIYFGTLGSASGSSNTDADQDGLSNWQEFRAGTHPRQQASTLRIRTIGLTQAGVAVAVDSTAGKLYQLEQSDSLNDQIWKSVGDVVIGTGGLLHFTISEQGPVNQFYRVRLVP
jgi:hypothetical protein